MLYTIGNIKFKDLTEDDFEILESFLLNNAGYIAGYSPNSLFAWNQVYHYGWTFLSDKTLLIACCRCIGEGCSLLCPIGEFHHDDQQILLQNILKEERPVNILAADDLFIKNNLRFIENFHITEDINQSNYIYSASDLAELPGGRYRKKRNHIQNAEKLYSWTVKEMTPEDIPECIEFLSVLDREIEGSPPGNTGVISAGLTNEHLALIYALKNFSRPGNKGVIIKVAGEISAFSIYEIINIHDELMAQVHYEKSLRSRKGLYQIVNHETAKIIHMQGINKINREEDLGDAGLRKAKRSYYPTEMIKAWNLQSK